MTTILNFDGESAPVIKRGATFNYPFRWEQPNGTPIDISFYRVLMQVRKNYGSELIVELSTTNNRIIKPSPGTVNLKLSAQETSLIPAGKYLYDLFLIDENLSDSNGDMGTISLLSGAITVENSIIVSI